MLDFVYVVGVVLGGNVIVFVVSVFFFYVGSFEDFKLVDSIDLFIVECGEDFFGSSNLRIVEWKGF